MLLSVAMAEDVPDGCYHLVAARKAQRGRNGRDRLVEAQLALLGQLGDHGGGNPLGDRRPAEYRFRGHFLARSLERFAIAVQEGYPAVLDDSDRHSDHRRLVHHSLEPGVEPVIIDAAAAGRFDHREAGADPCAGLGLGSFGRDLLRLAEGLGERERTDSKCECAQTEL
jgi:hypothetical protein